MRRLSIGLSVAAGLAASSAAHADTITILDPGSFYTPPGPVATFNDIPQSPYGSTVPTGPQPTSFTDGGATFSGGGIVMNNNGQGSDNLYATPYGDPTNYMAVLGGRSEKILFSGDDNHIFGLYWGSLDTYNYLTFYNAQGQEVALVSGSDVQPALQADGAQMDYLSNGYVQISGLPAFSYVMVTSGGNSFEFDNVIASVPEVSTWAMLGAGFIGLAGLAAVRRRKDRLAPALD